MFAKTHFRRRPRAVLGALLLCALPVTQGSGPDRTHAPLSPKSLLYTKVANNGTNLPDGAGLGTGPGDWACTRVNATGLVFEVKVTNPAALRHHGHAYTWFDSNGTRNGGVAGVANGGTCAGSGCGTEAYVAAVNASQLCGFNNWRLPSRAELQQILSAGNHGTGNPVVDPAFFPNVQASAYWASANFAANPEYAWQVSFGTGSGRYGPKAEAHAVMVVRP